MKNLACLCLLIAFFSVGCSNAITYHNTSITTNGSKAKKRILAVNADQFTTAAYKDIHYRLLSPANTISAAKYPLVLVLHGSGAIGTDNQAQLTLLAKYWAQPNIQQKYPAYILVPQFPVRSSNYTNDVTRNTLVSEPDNCLNSALELIDSLKKALPINPDKIYIMGFSMGASSTVNAIGIRPDLFAAGISVSGIPDFNHINELKNIPLWVIHGNADTENPGRTDSFLYHQLKAARGKLKYTIIEGLAHEVWPRLYTGEAMPKWLWSKQRNLN
ncbi:dienelactone hydrolase family protein [Mucilaginibacter gynuensis]|uniref:Dienelactone hydrolase family protein n=1 Tax=Mucilaginibacter gynuensis TaxID=1302236 RepID=A0ABP8FPI2_9SPHI